MAAIMKPTVYRDMKRCILVEEYENFVGTCFFLPSSGKVFILPFILEEIYYDSLMLPCRYIKEHMYGSVILNLSFYQLYLFRVARYENLKILTC